MIIGFCGQMHSGKDTAANYLIKKYNFEKRAFARKLKQHVAASLKVPFEAIDKYKNDPKMRVQVIRYWDLDEEKFDLISTSTFREHLKLEGTEGARDVFGTDFWVDQVLPVDGYYSGRNITISDVRFQNEVDRINQLGGFVCAIRRSATDKPDTHMSEQASSLTSVLYEIHNETTLDDFYAEIETMLTRILELARTDLQL